MMTTAVILLAVVLLLILLLPVVARLAFDWYKRMSAELDRLVEEFEEEQRRGVWDGELDALSDLVVFLLGFTALVLAAVIVGQP